MRSRSLAELRRALLGALPTAAVALAEGAWVAIAYAAIEIGLAHGPVVLDPWAFIVAAGIGIVVARRVRSRGATLILPVVAIAALVGWAADPMTRELTAAGALDRALAVHGARWLLGFAVWRGTRHRDPASDDLVVGSLLRWGVPALAVPWLVGTASSTRQAFVDVALPTTLIFVAAGLVAIGLTRLDALSRSAGVDWRGNRAWLGLLLGIVGLTIAIGTPIAFVLGASLDAIFGAILGPLAAIVGAAAAIIGPIGEVLGRALGPIAGPSSIEPPTSIGSPGATPPVVPAWLGSAIAVAIAMALVVGAARLWRLVRGAPRNLTWRPPKTEQRTIALPSLSVRLPRLRIPRLVYTRRWQPRTASEAYLALLRDLDGDERVARAPAESPASHAHRLRIVGVGAMSIDLLAADFELERYAGRHLTPAEVRRAIRRSDLARRLPRAGPLTVEG